MLGSESHVGCSNSYGSWFYFGCVLPYFVVHPGDFEKGPKVQPQVVHTWSLQHMGQRYNVDLHSQGLQGGHITSKDAKAGLKNKQCSAVCCKCLNLYHTDK